MPVSGATLVARSSGGSSKTKMTMTKGQTDE